MRGNPLLRKAPDSPRPQGCKQAPASPRSVSDARAVLHLGGSQQHGPASREVWPEALALHAICSDGRVLYCAEPPVRGAGGGVAVRINARDPSSGCVMHRRGELTAVS